MPSYGKVRYPNDPKLMKKADEFFHRANEYLQAEVAFSQELSRLLNEFRRIALNKIRRLNKSLVNRTYRVPAYKEIFDTSMIDVVEEIDRFQKMVTLLEKQAKLHDKFTREKKKTLKQRLTGNHGRNIEGRSRITENGTAIVFYEDEDYDYDNYIF